ncbi:MAG: radical SAM family heme chaperone HemW [Bacteroidetes bacterium]|nr:radical SAM family heme chaperone HemW [Bacteroidota bacterium]
MAGIYIHIPFCKQKCHYCNFYSSASQKNKSAFLEALLIEIASQKNYLQHETVSTIYFGGGTPSLLEQKEIQEILHQLNQYYKISDKAEITLEANPDDLSDEKLKALAATSINRLSIGIQSFFDDDLTYLNRSHSAEQAISAILKAQMAGFSNLSIDLIYGIPTLSNIAWKDNIETVLKLNIPHISAYSLTVEPNTALDVFIKKGKMKAVDEEKALQQFEILMNMLAEDNYIHYEISNFCKDGFISQHNSNYWKQKKYLGLGPSAHSYNLTSRQWNVASTSKYIQAVKNGEQSFEKEELSLSQQFNEYILTGLRCNWGINETEILDKYGVDNFEYFIKNIGKFIDKGLIENHEGCYILSRQGKFFADGIASELFKV